MRAVAGAFVGCDRGAVGHIDAGQDAARELRMRVDPRVEHRDHEVRVALRHIPRARHPHIGAGRARDAEHRLARVQHVPLEVERRIVRHFRESALSVELDARDRPAALGERRERRVRLERIGTGRKVDAVPAVEAELARERCVLRGRDEERLARCDARRGERRASVTLDARELRRAQHDLALRVRGDGDARRELHHEVTRRAVDAVHLDRRRVVDDERRRDLPVRGHDDRGRGERRPDKRRGGKPQSRDPGGRLRRRAVLVVHGGRHGRLHGRLEGADRAADRRTDRRTERRTDRRTDTADLRRPR